MNIENLNKDIQTFFDKYGGFTKLFLYLLVFLMCVGLIIYFIDIHINFREIARNPREWCFNSYLRVNYT
jgi:hypothetical protein